MTGLEQFMLSQGITNLVNLGSSWASQIYNNNFWSETGRFDRMVSQGFNPNLAAASVMGNAQSPASPLAGNASMQGLSEVLQTAAGQDVRDAEARYLNSYSHYLDTEADFIPIDSAARNKLMAAHAKHFDKLNSYYDDLSKDLQARLKWIDVREFAEIGKFLSDSRAAIANAAKAMSEAGYFGVATSLVSEEIKTQKEVTRQASARADIAENEAYVSSSTLGVQTKNVVDKARIDQAIAQLQEDAAAGNEWAVKILEQTQGLSVLGDIGLTLAAIKASGPEGSSMVDSTLNYIGDYMGAVYDEQSSHRLRNSWKDAISGLADVPSSFAQGVGWGFGSGLFGGARSGGMQVKGVTLKGSGNRSAPRPDGPTASPKPGTGKTRGNPTSKSWKDGVTYHDVNAMRKDINDLRQKYKNTGNQADYVRLIRKLNEYKRLTGQDY